MRNLVQDATSATLRDELEDCLQQKLRTAGDSFLPGIEYLKQWGYDVDETGTVPYTV